MTSIEEQPAEQIKKPRVVPLLFLIALVGWGLDFGTKQWAITSLSPGTATPLVGDLLQIKLVFNSGAAFSFAPDATLAFTSILLVVTVFIISVAHRVGNKAWAVMLGVLLAGVLGNVTDRLFRDPGFFVGHVVDFLYLKNMFIFNLADVWITAAVVIFAWISFHGIKMRDKSTDSADSDQDGAPDA